MKTLQYRVSYPRTHDWWSGHWWMISSWCINNIEHGEWDYINEHFVFSQESDKLMFVLKWSQKIK
jgi:hypothetical protein